MRGGDRQQTYSGDPNKSESHFAWDKPFRCIEDGKVRAVIDDVPDDFGRKANPTNTPIRNSSIVVEHSGGAYSIYNHPRQGSAIVKVGQMVKAGDVLGRVGNAGFSSEPHLHYRLHDPVGGELVERLQRAVGDFHPVAFDAESEHVDGRFG
jgi:murein DD-endopeptidase MepM/ murein hydrolase activator NlpD